MGCVYSALQKRSRNSVFPRWAKQTTSKEFKCTPCKFSPSSRMFSAEITVILLMKDLCLAPVDLIIVCSPEVLIDKADNASKNQTHTNMSSTFLFFYLFFYYTFIPLRLELKKTTHWSTQLWPNSEKQIDDNPCRCNSFADRLCK